MTRFFADVMHIVKHDEPVGRGAARTVLETLTNGVGIGHVSHQSPSPSIDIHLSAGGERKGLNDAIRVVCFVDTESVKEACSKAKRPIPRLAGVPANRQVWILFHVLLKPVGNER